MTTASPTRRKRGPGRPTHERMAYLLDRLLLRILTHGQQAVSSSGRPIVDENGKPVYKEPSAELLNCVRMRLRDVAAMSGRGRLQHPAPSVLDNIRERMKAVGGNSFRIPPLDTENDDAATA